MREAAGTAGAGALDRPRLLAAPPGLAAPGSASATFWRAFSLAELPLGALRRFSVGDLDILIAHTSRGLLATDDRCPHMAVPLSLGTLEGCVVACPLHEGRFDLATGEPVQFPSTGGLDALGMPHAPKPAPESVPRPAVREIVARAQAATRVRRLRYYPLRIVDGWLGVGVPAA